MKSSKSSFIKVCILVFFCSLISTNLFSIDAITAEYFKSKYKHPAVNSSERYRALFNQVAEELDFDFRYKMDSEEGIPNILEPEHGEVEFLGLLRGCGHDPEALKGSILVVMALIEKRRLAVVKGAYEQFAIKLSPTFEDDEKLNYLTPVEKKWLSQNARELMDISLDIYAKQVREDADLLKEWMDTFGDRYSKKHYYRIRKIGAPGIENSAFIPKGLEENAKLGEGDDAPKNPMYYGNYSSLFPWFPDEAKQESRMWPFDMEDSEIDKIKDPVLSIGSENALLPYTIVERAYFSGGLNAVFAGDRKYVATNISSHNDFSPLLGKFARVLDRGAVILPVDSKFEKYTINMADYLQQGRYAELLKADLNQIEGNIYFSFFPHESYWRDCIKFPFALLIGIRDKKFQEAMVKYGDSIVYLENLQSQILQEKGFDYEPRKVKADDIKKSVEAAWMYVTGGFFRAFPEGEPFGNDYPYVKYPGVEGHRVVVWLDAALAKYRTVIVPLAKEILTDDDYEKYIDFDSLLYETLGHEIIHGTGPRKETIVASNGKTFGENYGIYWGTWAETIAYMGSIIMFKKLVDEGKFPEADYRKVVVSALMNTVRFYMPKEFAKKEEKLSAHFHAVGNMMFFGWLMKKENGAVELVNGKLKIKWDKIYPASEEFFKKLVLLQGSNDVNIDFLKFAREDCLNHISPEFETRVQNIKASMKTEILVSRGLVGELDDL